MRTATLPLPLLALFLAACGSPAPSAPLPDGRTPALNSAARPVSGECETTFTPPPFPPPPSFTQVDTGTCQLAHLGRVDLRSEQTINFAAGTQSGERTLTAANGDILRAVHTGTSRLAGPGQVRFAATLRFVGGTGRFAGATGTARAEGTAHLGSRTATMRIVDGWIAYAAQDRSGS
ncbi:MAG: hypothetical protein AVDCRST_MAG68-1356 [uncultured Gemmatimonadetes bacterium]|uniref:Uncharacterized protein n=1 Tax=uncultured Gemmatimonadota bacterium TaxID=203437 RepID=A0A6J4KS39_9BACT|nr:MAG: hypothetical protein AVDCRST_MAG68-1356 [uncultured Gemmatimonadota bacterium]